MVYLSNKALRIIFKRNRVWTLFVGVEIIETFWEDKWNEQIVLNENNQYEGSIELVRESWMRGPIALSICSLLPFLAREL